MLLGACVVAAAVWVGLVGLQSRHAFLHDAAPVLLAPLALWLFFSERYAVTLAVLLLYLGLLDGVVKLAFGSNLATLGRDVLLYAIALGALVRVILRRSSLPAPALTGIVLAWVAVCVMQVANPADVSRLHALAALRQDLEFVPLFFFGFYVLRSEHRIRNFLLLLLLVAAVNGIVNVIQSGLSPTQLASWGPGYHNLELGIANSVSRTFVTASGQVRVRPPGLGGEDGFGSLLCMFAIPAAAALLADLRRARKLVWLLVPCTALAIAGIVTSEERVVVLGSVVALSAFTALAFTSQRRVGALVVVILVGMSAYLIGSAVLSGTENRYSSISPSNVVSTSTGARAKSIALLPTYFVRYPLGAGLGQVGPASGSGVGGAATTKLNGETEFNFLLVETGIPGLLVMLVFTILTVRNGLTLRRVRDPGLQRCLVALTAVAATLFVIWFDSPVTASSPTSPFLWFSAGCLAYWSSELRSGRIPVRARRVQAALAYR